MTSSIMPSFLCHLCPLYVPFSIRWCRWPVWPLHCFPMCRVFVGFTQHEPFASRFSSIGFSAAFCVLGAVLAYCIAASVSCLSSLCPVLRGHMSQVSYSIRKAFTPPPCLLALLCPVCRVMSGCRKPFEPFCEAFPGDPSYDLIGPFVAPFLPPEFCFIFVLFFFRSASGELRAILL